MNWKPYIRSNIDKSERQDDFPKQSLSDEFGLTILFLPLYFSSF